MHTRFLKQSAKIVLVELYDNQFCFFFRRILIHDCSSQVFQLFMRFIYTGQTGSDVSLEVLTDLIALADRLVA